MTVRSRKSSAIIKVSSLIKTITTKKYETKLLNNITIYKSDPKTIEAFRKVIENYS